MSPYKALVFDLGKVVFDLSFDRVFQFWAAASGRQADEIKGRFTFDDSFTKFETDELTPAEFRASLSASLGLTLTDQAFDEGWCALYLEAYCGIDALLAELKQRYQLVALTNTNRIHSPAWQTKYARPLRHFQQVFSSHELKARKPDAPAYQAALAYLGVAPQQVVFLDDSPDNVEGAARLGMQTILVTSYEQMTAELQRIGLLR